ncbi:MAG: amino acid racemase [Bacteroidales bacterium]
MTKNEHIIGIVGGVGPYAGLDLTQKIFNETIAGSDQEHLPVALFSIPHKIADRSEFLMGKTNINPAYAVHEIILKLEQAGANVIGIPCNTMHAPEIFNTIQSELKTSKSKVQLINMITEVIQFIKNHYSEIHKIGILSTTGTYQSKVYENSLINAGLEPVVANPDLQERIHQAIYHPEYGIKTVSNPVTKKAKNTLVNGIRSLKSKGAEGIILGCTEIPYALPYKKISNLPLLDATQILARALIRNTYPEKLLDYIV